MSNIITARDPDIIAAEINTIKREVRETVIFASIKIGQKLTEAKSLVSHGEWGRWLEENVEYSQSTANYLMQLYQEYGTGQESLFDTWTNSQTFAKLTYSQHIALLSLPFEDRQEFAEQNHVEDMSTRQLQKAIQEAKEQLNTADDKIMQLEAQLRDANQRLLDAQQVAANAKSTEGAWEQEIKKLNAEKHLAETAEKNAMKKVEVLEKQLKAAKETAKQAKEDLKKAKENPEVPGALLEQIRAEAEAAAAQKDSEDIRKQLDAANAALEKAEQKVRESEEKLDSAQKQMRMSDPDLMAIQTLGRQILSFANSINGHRMKAIMQNEANAKPINGFLLSVVEELRESFGIKTAQMKG